MYTLRIGLVDFEWDEAKCKTNIRKHGVSFVEAASAFRDENASLYFDAAHSESEDRYYLIGTSSKLNVLVVMHCYRGGGLTTRIISARKATTNEKIEYAKNHAG